MCCVRFTMSPSARKEVERHLKTAQQLGNLRQVKYLLAILAREDYGWTPRKTCFTIPICPYDKFS